MNLWQRIHRVRQSRQTFEGNAADRAGRAAENIFYAEVSERLKGSGYRVWHGVRVPAQGRRREIDIVITTLNEIYLLELKNWSGQLVLNGDEVVQIRTNQQQAVNHGRLFHDVKAREQALQNWHWERTRERLPMHSLVVFCNPRLRIDDAVLSKYGDKMCASSEFIAGLPTPTPHRPSKSFWKRILGISDEESVRSEPDATGEIQRFCGTMEGLGSWDSVRMHGGALVNGDVRERGDWVSLGLEGEEKVRLFDRQRIRSILVHAKREWWNLLTPIEGLELTLVLRDGGRARLQVPYDTTLSFQAAGSAEPEEMPLVHVEQLDFGYIKKHSSKKG